jgi:hydrogenase maturation factor
MEICGGQTHSIVKYGVDELLPEKINLIHGPGCPVCVTPAESIDKAIALASRPDIIFCSFGAEVQNQYSRSVHRQGNEAAQKLIREVFEVVPRQWRGIGAIPQSGLGLRDKYAQFDAEHCFNLSSHPVQEERECLSELVCT